MELADKHVVITGAASGIGRACAQTFAREGARLVLADLDEEAVQAVARELGATATRTDVGHERDIRALVDAAQQRNGPIDLWYSNAGVGGPAGGPEASDAAIQATWEVNVMAHVYAARALLPEMVARGDGYLVSTASAAGLLTQLSAMAYTVTKHAAVALAEWLSITYADAGIKVSCVCPQGVSTPMLALAVREDPVGAAPMLAQRVLEPEEVAVAVLAGIREERFLILPHEEVAGYMAYKGAKPERWQEGMRTLLAQARAAHGDSDRDQLRRQSLPAPGDL
jgi:NAD(P)-dependent dehydrogenase (short-subunit alcohol dehydrogenase family)